MAIPIGGVVLSWIVMLLAVYVRLSIELNITRLVVATVSSSKEPNMRSSAVTRSDEITAGQLSLSFGGLWHGFLTAPWSFKFTCLYVFWEYVRPQHIYPWLEGPPWTLGSLVLAVAFFVAEGFRLRSRTLLNVLLVLFTLVVVASSINAYNPDESFSQLDIWFNWVIAFVLIANTANTERRLFIFVLLFMLWCTKMSQHGFISWATRGFGFSSWGVTGGPGWFQNSGEFALQMGVFFPLSLYVISAVRKSVSFPKFLLLWFLPVSAVGSIIASSSRGGLLALAGMGIWFVLRSRHRIRMAVVLAALSPLVWAVVPQGQKDRFQTAGTDKTSLTRLAYWKAGMDMASEQPVLGVGYGNWAEYYRDFYWDPTDSLAVVNLRGEPVVEVAHNSFVEVMSQLGYTGLAVYCCVLFGIWVVNSRSRRILDKLGPRGRTLHLVSLGLDAGVISIAVAGFFMSIAFYPFLWFQAGMTAGLHAAAVALASGKRLESPQSAAAQKRRPLSPQRIHRGSATYTPSNDPVPQSS